MVFSQCIVHMLKSAVRSTKYGAVFYKLVKTFPEKLLSCQTPAQIQSSSLHNGDAQAKMQQQCKVWGSCEFSFFKNKTAFIKHREMTQVELMFEFTEKILCLSKTNCIQHTKNSIETREHFISHN